MRRVISGAPSAATAAWRGVSSSGALVPGGVGFSGLDAVKAQAFAKALFTATADFDVANQPTGAAACDRVVSNTALAGNPFQPSCIEIRLPQRHKPVCSRKKKIDFAQLRRERDANAGDDAAYRSMPEADSAHDQAEVVIYYETSTDAGLQGFQFVAAQIKLGLLPGRCENATAVGGFATWIVPRPQYIEMVKSRTQISDE